MRELPRIGDRVGRVDLSVFGPLEVPLPKRWHLLRIRPNRETQVLRSFEQRNISAYLPRVTHTVANGLSPVRQLRRTVISPLFPGLIFMPDFEFSNRQVLATDGVAGYLRFGEHTAYLTHAVFCDVRAIEAAANIPHSKRKRLYELGQLVQVIDGPLASWTGRIERLDAKGRYKILVNALARGMMVSLTERQIESVPVE
jgi:transcriptional antiterminator NusG